MSAPTEGSETSDSQIQVEWASVTDAGTPTGNSAVTSYQLLWDNGDAARTDFLSLMDDLVTSHTVVGVTEGAFYRFKIRAVNVYGAGIDSAEASIRASDVPSRMSSVTTTRDGTDVRAAFVTPNANGADVEKF